MITARKHSEGVLQLLDSIGRIVGWIYSPHDLKDGDKFPIKTITLDGDKIRVEVERPLSLMEAATAAFTLEEPTTYWSPMWRAIYDAWLREKEKEKTQ